MAEISLLTQPTAIDDHIILMKKVQEVGLLCVFLERKLAQYQRGLLSTKIKVDANFFINYEF